MFLRYFHLEPPPEVKCQPARVIGESGTGSREGIGDFSPRKHSQKPPLPADTTETEHWVGIGALAGHRAGSRNPASRA